MFPMHANHAAVNLVKAQAIGFVTAIEACRGTAGRVSWWRVSDVFWGDYNVK